MTIILQDGRRGGHLKWALQAINSGLAEGVFINPFHTPRVAVARHSPGSQVAETVLGAQAEVIFDASTHAFLLPASNDLVHYRTWSLWGPSGVGLDDDLKRLEHIELVSARQAELEAPRLAPTLALDNPLGVPAQHAFRTAEVARSLDRDTWQSLAGRRAFWRGGADLDAFVGQLAALRAPVWVLTVVNDLVADNQPDHGDRAAFEGLLRSVHSLSTRSRVILAYSDYAGAPAIAAGASDVGTGWDRGMRFFDPLSFQLSSPGVRIAASYVTQGGLAAVLKRDTADAITRLLGDPAATTLRGGPMPADDTAERSHHLRQLHALADSVSAHGLSPSGRRDRVRALRGFYEAADVDFRRLVSGLPRRTLTDGQRIKWNTEPYNVLHAYAMAEGLW